MLVSKKPDTVQVQPAGFIILTQNGIPGQQSHPGPESVRVHGIEILLSQSYFQIESAWPLQISANNAEDLVSAELAYGKEIKFMPAHKLNRNEYVRVGVGGGVNTGMGVFFGVEVKIETGVLRTVNV